MKFWNLTILCISFLLMSCDNEDYIDINDIAGGFGITDDGIVGLWLMTEFNLTDPIDLNNDGTAEANLIAESNCYTNETIVLNSDFTALSATRSFLDLTIELVAGTTDEFAVSNLDCVQETEITNNTWMRDGAQLTLTDENNLSQRFTLIDETSFTLVIPSGYTYTNDAGEVVLTQDITFIYTKQ